MDVLTKEQHKARVLIPAILSFGVIYLFFFVGWAPAIVVAGAGVVAYWFWYKVYLKKPVDPAVILPPFLLTAGGFAFHLVEEYFGHYGPAISRLFNIGWTQQAFVAVSLVLCGALALISVGLFYRKSVAGFAAILFLVTRLAEFGLFIFPLVPPALHPEINHPISQAVSGVFVEGMPNYYLHVAGTYYFPGLYTVALPMIPALYALYRLWGMRPRNKGR